MLTSGEVDEPWLHWHLVTDFILRFVLAFYLLLMQISKYQCTCLYRKKTCLHEWAPEFTTAFSGIRVAQSLVFCVVFCRSLLVFFLLAIALSVFLWFTVSGYPLGILNLSYRCNTWLQYLSLLVTSYLSQLFNVRLISAINWKIIKYHTVGTIPKSNCKTREANSIP